MRIGLSGLLEELARRHGLPPLKMDERGVVTLRVDGRFVVSMRTDGAQVLLDAEVGALPDHGREACLERMLQIRFVRMKRQRELLYLAPEEKPVFRLRLSLSMDDLDVRRLEEGLKRYLDCLDFWHRQLSLQTPASPRTGVLFP